MVSEIPSTTDPKVFSGWLDRVIDPGDTPDVKAVVSNIGGGLLRFTEVVFNNTPVADVLAKHHQREPAGRGAHFDVYQSIVSSSHPWVAVYNLAGTVSVTTAKLPSELADDYFGQFPERTEAAIDVVNEYSARVMDDPTTEVFTATIGAGSGLIIPQCAEGPHIIHDIVPVDPADPGQFVKLVIPEAADPRFRNGFLSRGYLPLGEYVDISLIQSPQNDH